MRGKNSETLFRVISVGNGNFLLQERFGKKYIVFTKWRGLAQSNESEYLIRQMKDIAIARNKEKSLPKKGDVMAVYTEADLVVDKLKAGK